MTETLTASCHCGAVKLEAEFPQGLASAARCDCSFCRRRGAAAVTAIAASLRVTKGVENLTLYTWGTGTAKHHFCKICGIYTHHQRRLDPSECGVNLGCIQNVNPRDHDPIPWHDGVNHPSDRAK
ncbi:Glutathione-dependent formaldehyde-activating enzyme [Falsiruegeria litorea R37]|uniref:Glutathione-dependent formaldehyde-activating enzyme n=1 Tax=Falsiruegeria litorea R37 TaxID=1200284 RepID=A0A1Y5T9H8_9RHOB|nr:GFA family protein [Falsiruegeria litorea]SLN55377.1 Glutathione-dependent formaldehyde-activating enzyme [Falsiruegeria litorea R37]